MRCILLILVVFLVIPIVKGDVAGGTVYIEPDPATDIDDLECKVSGFNTSQCATITIVWRQRRSELQAGKSRT